MLKVIKVIPYADYTIEIHYSNKEIKIFDMKPLFEYEIYKPLINKNLFYTVKPFYNTITWDDDIDIAPETLYEDSVKKNNKVKIQKIKKESNKRDIQY